MKAVPAIPCIPAQMVNILDEAPATERHGRLAYTTDRFVDAADIRGKNVLDIGCGYGWFELWALQQGVANITGVELSDENLSTARKHIHDSRARFEVGSGIDLQYPPQSFDTVVALEVIEHIPPGTEGRMLLEVSRMLKPGGMFYLSTPNAHLFSRLFDVAFWLNNHRHYSAQTITGMATKVGLTLQRKETKGGWLEIADIWNMYASKWILRRERLCKGLSLALSDVSYLCRGGFNGLFMKFRKAG